ncbi:sodium-dependent bicarbonate transport family permease [Limibaculum sp. M0105]|uniref:Sodium-dependent bicarbonate transport family permease n=1 Tax=Thermohalobaculum xanthum TaxID=2753746 RepID=A0A8J7MA66_9RHOB|nr:sodium-dependent bicarbonate transport family permease [Thermohalobaculum xanthum]MBK0400605.1 sodium-dependent bicarbonate transport family permease [Thermohalobaculum xanthum]
MGDILALAGSNLVSPMVLSFALGFAAALARSDLSFPEAAAKALSLYLLFAIGFKGGASVADHGLDATLVLAIAAGAALSAVIPLIAFALLQAISGLDRVNAAAVAAHYGSISIVTFVAATSALTTAGEGFEGYLVAVAAVMETPAILVALWLARAGRAGAAEPAGGTEPGLWREIALNGSIVLLTGAFLIGLATGPSGLAEISSFIIDPFKGVLCLFLLDMGLVAGRGMRTGARHLAAPVIGFGLCMPLIGAALGLAAGTAIGLSTGGIALMATLAASASYIAVPAAMRVALPEANPSIYLTLSLGVTFPFNLTVGIPLYSAAAALVSGG